MALLRILQQFQSACVVKSRALSTQEKALAYSVFGESLALDGIRIIAHRLILRNYAMSPNGHVYFHPENWCDDFSKCSLAQQSWLIHELTHVWQVQRGLKVIRGALFNRKYSYVLIEGKKFFKYGIEQQARMVQDYFIRREQGQDCSAYENCIPFLNMH